MPPAGRRPRGRHAHYEIPMRVRKISRLRSRCGRSRQGAASGGAEGGSSSRQRRPRGTTFRPRELHLQTPSGATGREWQSDLRGPVLVGAQSVDTRTIRAPSGMKRGCPASSEEWIKWDFFFLYSLLSFELKALSAASQPRPRCIDQTRWLCFRWGLSERLRSGRAIHPEEGARPFASPESPLGRGVGAGRR
jgi:hypothetical protein